MLYQRRKFQVPATQPGKCSDDQHSSTSSERSKAGDICARCSTILTEEQAENINARRAAGRAFDLKAECEAFRGKDGAKCLGFRGHIGDHDFPPLDQ